jgi:aryl-alcohol dehydrogenase-like predicted oxidoreductase
MNSRIILGTVQFGLRYGINNQNGKPAIEQVFKMLELASERGVGILDTADAYGNATELLGEFNRLNPGAFKINTKFKVGQQSIEEQLAGSLLQLSADSINTYFFHSFDDFLNKPELLSDLVSLKEKGLIKKTGVSVYGNDEFELAINTQGVDVIQFPFNLLDNRFQRGRIMVLAKEKGKELQVRSVFLQGLFFKPPKELPEKLFPLKPYLKTVSDIAYENNLSIENLALMYSCSQPEIDYVIIGVDNPLQLQKNLNACQQNISEEVAVLINQIAVQETDLLYPKNWN